METKEFQNLTFISAGAGSGKTYSLIEKLVEAICDEGVSPAKVIAVTFTQKAAQELRERLLVRIQELGRFDLAEQISQGLIGTVHSVCAQLLSEFAFELGLPIRQNVITDAENEEIFNQALDESPDIRLLEHVTRLTASLLNPTSLRQTIESKWKDDVRRICEKARTNNISDTTLEQLAVQSADSLLAYFPEVNYCGKKEKLKQELLDAVHTALKDIDLRIDTTVATRNYINQLRRLRGYLTDGDCPWWVWVDLATLSPGATSRPAAEQVREAAGIYIQMEEFQADLCDLTMTVVNLAASTLDRYRDLKSELGVIDFVDMEHLTYRALDNEIVAEKLKDLIEYMVVDEFQDTSPIQLAIFARIAAFADRMVFVGDVKQSIYRFREADVELVLTTRNDIMKRGASQERLENNWRSNPDLVELVNTTFTRVFSRTLGVHEMRLTPRRKKLTNEPGLIRWTLSGNDVVFWNCLVQEVKNLVNSDRKFIVEQKDDTENTKPRKVEYGDIAVLVRTNSHLQAITSSFKNAGVPVKVSLPNLLDTPEIVLALACLRRLNDVTDSYATAEIVSLSDSKDPEDWLADRIRWLEEKNAIDNLSDEDVFDQLGEDDRASHLESDWQEDEHRIVKRLSEIRGTNLLRSPVEIVAYVINEVGVRQSVSTWGPTLANSEQRQANLDNLLDLAGSYEEWSERRHEAATITGFLVWLESIRDSELNRQSITLAASDSVHVSTLHGAKGLEWPVVVVVDLYRPRKFDFGGVHIVKPDEFSALDPLKGRGLHYWPNPFGSRSAGIEVIDTIRDSAWGQEALAAERAETERLMYVALTRAKDLTIVANKHSKKSVDPVSTSIVQGLHGSVNGFCSPNDTGTIELDKDESIKVELVEMDPAGIEDPVRPEFESFWFVHRELVKHLPRVVLPSQAHSIAGSRMGETIPYAARIRLNTPDMTALGTAIHAILAMEFINPNQKDRIEKASEILKSHGLSEDFVDLEKVFASIQGLQEKGLAEFTPSRVRLECPVHHTFPNGQTATGYIDLLIESNKGLVVVDHKANPRSRDKWHEQVFEYSGQLSMYKEALSATHTVRSTWLNFVIPGTLVEVVLP